MCAKTRTCNMYYCSIDVIAGGCEIVTCPAFAHIWCGQWIWMYCQCFAWEGSRYRRCVVDPKTDRKSVMFLDDMCNVLIGGEIKLGSNTRTWVIRGCL